MSSILRSSGALTRQVFRHMASSQAGILSGKIDEYNGVTVESGANALDAAALGTALSASLARWTANGVRGCWLNIALAQAHWVPVCAEAGFEFHHARSTEVVMVKWLQPTKNQLPRYPFTQVGVGGVVVDPVGRVLLMRELRGRYLGWKFPGGLLDPGEDLEAGCAREVEEETGVKCRLRGVITWRHSHEFRYPDCSDMYFLLVGEPVGEAPFTPKPCALEASDARWFSRSEIEALDEAEHITGLNLWALDMADKYRDAGFPDGIVLKPYDQLLRRYGRQWNAHHLDFPENPAANL